MAESTYAIFPFLKTSRPVQIGSLTFRSTQDVDGLPEAERIAVREIADMLFLKDDLRLQSSSCAILPLIDLNRPHHDKLRELIDVQAVVAYLYASPHERDGDLFLSSEHASLALFTPGPVTVFVARPDYHVIDLGEPLTPDARHNVAGYVGLYNFRHHFWVTKGSRLYGPMPCMTLNTSQDLCDEVEYAPHSREDYRLLVDLLRRPPTEAAQRAMTAVRWFNAANREANDDSESIVHLAIAFETLLKLPPDSKTNRFTDTVSLLLGRIPRLDQWADQFFDARSRIVHEGHAEQLQFFVGDRKRASEGQLYQSLLAYGRQIFQLCLGSLLLGLKLAERAGIEEKLVTNQERFEAICKILREESIEVVERLRRITPIVAAIKRYRFVPESNFKLASVMGAMRTAVTSLLIADPTIHGPLKDRLSSFSAAKRSSDHFEELHELWQLAETLTEEDVKANYISDEVPPATAVFRLVKEVWLDVSMHYFWLKERREKPGDGSAE